MMPPDAQQDGTTASLFARSAGSGEGTAAALFARSARSAVHGPLVGVHGPLVGGWHPLTSPSVWSSNERPVYGRGAAASEALVSPPSFTAPRSVTGATAAPLAPAVPLPETIRVGKDGRIEGADGMLDQIAQALTRHAGPMLARDVLPIVQRDEALHTRVGQAAGDAMAAKLKPWVIAGASALAILAAIEGYRLYTERTPRTPSSRR